MSITILNIFGWIIVIFGLMTVLGDGSHYKGFYVSPNAGYAEIVLGVIILFWIRKNTKKITAEAEAEDNKKDLICTKCQTVYLADNLPEDYQDGICSKCGSNLEPLNGFYERHPELKDIPEHFSPPEKD